MAGADRPGGPPAGRPGPLSPRAIAWALLMVVWLGALAFGLWWIWPHVARGALTAELVTGLVWLVIGAAAWLVALDLGRRRYWRDRSRRPPAR